MLDTNLIGIKPNSIELNYVFEGINKNYTFYLFNNSYYIGKPIKVDLKQRGDFPFEDYNTTIFISINDMNFANRNFSINSTRSNVATAHPTAAELRGMIVLSLCSFVFI